MKESMLKWLVRGVWGEMHIALFGSDNYSLCETYILHILESCKHHNNGDLYTTEESTIRLRQIQSLVHVLQTRSDQGVFVVGFLSHFLIPTTTRFLGLCLNSNTGSTHASATVSCSLRNNHLSTTIAASITPALKAIKLHMTLNSFPLSLKSVSYPRISSSLMLAIFSVNSSPRVGSLTSFSNAPRT
jgi:hypothetical protein